MEALEKPNADVPQALLCGVQVDDLGEFVKVPVTDASGRVQSRSRYLFQIGTGAVTCSIESIPKGTFRKKTVLASVVFKHKDLDKQTWDRAVSEPEETVSTWLAEKKVQTLEVHGPTGGPGRAKVVVRLESHLEDTFLRLSGQDGIARPLGQDNSGSRQLG